MSKIKITAVILLVVLLFSIVCSATIGTRTASLLYEDIKIMLDGEPLIPVDANGNPVEPFIIEGTTYLPVRGISSALGLNVGWVDETKTVELSTPGIFAGGVQVYDDENVTIEFAGCRMEKPYEWMDTVYYYADFNINNKTDTELTFQIGSIALNGYSYSNLSGSEEVAPKSTGKVSFSTQEQIPTSGINKTSGKISVIDFDKNVLEKMSYDANWVDITQE